MNKKIAIIIALALFIALAALAPKIKADNDKYNKYMCAVNGYQADCKTPLKASEGLK